MFDNIRGKKVEALWDAFQAQDKYYYFDQIPMRYTEDEEQKFGDLERQLLTLREMNISRDSSQAMLILTTTLSGTRIFLT